MENLETKVTFLGKVWGIRLLRVDTQEVIVETSVDQKDKIGPAIASLLRWQNKLGSPSPMAEASRERFYCYDRKGRKYNT